jgi:creatinine amidohydrolase
LDVDQVTEYFSYANLTWPDVAALRRDTPLVIPLGSGWNPGLLAESLGDPPRLGLLPPIPYGWRGSLVEVPPLLLGTFLSNLLDSLRDDGFTRVYALVPQGLYLGLGSQAITMGPLPAEPVSQLSKTEHGKVVLMPIGHTEQHGHHLPMCVDTICIEAVALGAAAAVPEQAACLPVMPYGVSMHRQAFAGTLDAGGRAFEDFYVAVLDSLSARGFDRFYLLSGHGGNSSFLVNVVKYAGERHRRAFIATAFLYLSGVEGVAALQKHRRSPIGGMGHACELETSLMLHLRPGLVDMPKVVDETDFVATPNYYMDWVEGGALFANPPWDDDTKTGAYGAGSFATAENGKIWLEAAITEKVKHVAEIHEQHTRREARRESGFGLWGM